MYVAKNTSRGVSVELAAFGGQPRRRTERMTPKSSFAAFGQVTPLCHERKGGYFICDTQTTLYHRTGSLFSPDRRLKPHNLLPANQDPRQPQLFRQRQFGLHAGGVVI